jgi:hypothetical protein
LKKKKKKKCAEEGIRRILGEKKEAKDVKICLELLLMIWI